MRKHSGEKPFNCNQCNFSCTTAGYLKTHLLIHSGEKPFSCSQCEYSCTTSSHLKRHMMIHSGDNPFSCIQCNYSCTTASHLRSQMMTHSGEKRFSCTQCDFCCKHASSLKLHNPQLSENYPTSWHWQVLIKEKEEAWPLSLLLSETFKNKEEMINSASSSLSINK